MGKTAWRARGVALSIGVLGGVAACVDLFHSTNFETLCDLDAAACAAVDASADGAAAAPRDAGAPDGPTDFCQWDSVTAGNNAAHACAWLGACAGPLGENALGPCIVNATLAYDCAANPNRPVVGAAHAYWDILWQAASCGDVLRAVQPSSTACAAAPASYVTCEAATRVACGPANAMSAPVGVEDCAAAGQTCALVNGSGACVGPSSCAGATAVLACGASGGPTLLADCEDGGTDLGVDCANFGGGSCTASGGVAACRAVDGGSCTPSSAITCGTSNPNVATG